MKKLLLHACCADCVLKFIESAKADNFDEVVVYYYNPNIHPRAEYLTRLKAIQDTLLPLNIKIIVADYSPKDYFKVVKDPAKPARCAYFRTIPQAACLERRVPRAPRNTASAKSRRAHC